MLIAGAGGFAREILEVICQNNENEDIVFFDDHSVDKPGRIYNKYDVLADIEAAKKYFSSVDKRFVLGVGSPLLRYQMAKKFESIGGILTTIQSPFARVGRFENQIGSGTNILTGVTIEAGNTIGIGCLLHNNSFISHDVSIGVFCEISPSANLLGNSATGNFCSIGTGAVLLPGIKIGNNVLVGAGAVVTKNVGNDCVLKGVPASITRQTAPLNIGFA